MTSLHNTASFLPPLPLPLPLSQESTRFASTQPDTIFPPAPPTQPTISITPAAPISTPKPTPSIAALPSTIALSSVHNVDVAPVSPAFTAGVSIDVDDSNLDENDSTCGDDAESMGSASVTTSIYEFRYENGRRYHAYRDGKYLLPNDELEQDRLDLQHHIFRLLLDGHLHRAPLIHGTVHRALDFGTGTGIWALDFADEFPEAIVIGTDLSPIQPTWIPPNSAFYVDDVESTWVYSDAEQFDYIHSRSMGGCISDWNELYQNVYAHLKPGGWVEAQGVQTFIFSQNDSTLSRTPFVKRWHGLVNAAADTNKKKMNIASSQKYWMLAAGFENVRDDVYQVPIGVWPRDRRYKEIGLYQLESIIMSLESYTLALLSRVFSWTNQEIQVLIAGVKQEFRDQRNHFFLVAHFAYGQKPQRPVAMPIPVPFATNVLAAPSNPLPTALSTSAPASYV